MQWKKYDSVDWKTSGFDQDQPQKNQIRYDSLQPTHPELAKEEYELNAKEFNPSAEMARIFELIMYNVAAGGNARPPYDYLLTCSSFEWRETKREKVLSEVKQLHNFAHKQIQRFTAIWSSHWGQPNNDKYNFKEKDYLKIAARFYNLYSLAHDNKLVKMDYEEINENIRLHCDVGIHKVDTEHNIGITPQSLLGFIWLNLADDIANKKNYGICQGRTDCIRILSTKLENETKTCSLACTNHLKRNPNVEIFPSTFEGRIE